ncbi:MAG: hypothetical protein J0H15_05985 [Xanthomonadales bacterium]|nr:hypothetical protein [Xanthomonadales bacterium]
MNTHNGAIDAVVHNYVSAAKDYGKALENGNHLKANEAHELIGIAFNELRALRYEEALLLLLVDKNRAVRYSAAVNLLDAFPYEAESALEEVVNGPPSPIRLMAQISLGEWRKQK